MQRVNRIIKWAPCILLCVAAFSPAQAAVVFQGGATGAFSHSLAGTGGYSKIWNWYTSTFEWGAVKSKTSCVKGQCQNIPLPRAGSSLFAFSGIGSDGSESGYTTGLGRVFSFSAFNYLNLPISFPGGTTGMGLAMDVGLNARGVSKSFTYRESFFSTTNSLADVPGLAMFPGLSAPFDSSHDWQTYNFSLESYTSSFFVDDKRFIRLDQYSRFDYILMNETTAVPVPAALGLLGSGLVGLLGLGYRTKQSPG